MTEPPFLERLFRWACWLDVAVAKPGNVSVGSPGHGMTADHFIASAQAAAAPLCRQGTRVGRRIEAAVAASWDAAHCNTNLGIVLLCAPVAAAWERCGAAVGEPVPEPALRQAIVQVLDDLDVEDARAAYRGIARANPGGLGRAPEQDVAQAPDVNLKQAMALAAGRDRIAAQYAGGFSGLFERALPSFRQGLARRAPSRGDAIALPDAIVNTFLGCLAAWPDSHILRKHGAAVAQSVTAQAADVHAQWLAGTDLAAGAALSSWDSQLKTLHINPGTSADLTVATAFVAACLDPSLVAGSFSGTVVA